MRWSIADTTHLQELCYALRAREYAKYYQNIPQDYFFDAIDTQKAPDGNLIASTALVEHDGEVIATARLAIVFYPHYDLITGETFKLIYKDEKLLCDLRRTCGVDDMTTIGEIGKLAVSQKYRKPEVIQLIFRAVATIAQTKEIGLLIGLMPPHIAKSVFNAGIKHTHFSNVRLDRSNCDNLRYFFRFHDYFLPTLYKANPEICHPQNWESLTYSELLAISNQHQDGPQLYWITPETILSSKMELINHANN